MKKLFLLSCFIATISVVSAQSASRSVTDTTSLESLSTKICSLNTVIVNLQQTSVKVEDTYFQQAIFSMQYTRLSLSKLRNDEIAAVNTRYDAKIQSLDSLLLQFWQLHKTKSLQNCKSTGSIFKRSDYENSSLLGIGRDSIGSNRLLYLPIFTVAERGVRENNQSQVAKRESHYNNFDLQRNVSRCYSKIPSFGYSDLRSEYIGWNGGERNRDFITGKRGYGSGDFSELDRHRIVGIERRDSNIKRPPKLGYFAS
jgi:hypothetical protein